MKALLVNVCYGTTKSAEIGSRDMRIFVDFFSSGGGSGVYSFEECIFRSFERENLAKAEIRDGPSRSRPGSRYFSKGDR